MLALLRSAREPVCGTTLFDTGGTVLLALAAAHYLGWPPLVTVAGAFGLGFATHALLGVQTVFNKQ